MGNHNCNLCNGCGQIKNGCLGASVESAGDHGEVGGGGVLLRSMEGAAPGQAPELTFPEAARSRGVLFLLKATWSGGVPQLQEWFPKACEVRCPPDPALTLETKREKRDREKKGQRTPA